jgi:pimeloyl-ACP methyl ester carboxylesterase
MRKYSRATLIITCFALLACVSFGVLHAWLYAVPHEHPAADDVYSQMPKDRFHRHIKLPVDHNDLVRGTFSSFYLLNPNYFEHKNDNVTFFLTDGQMELVGTKTDFGFFNEVLGGTPYVLIAVRGHAPNFLPEVFPNGIIDYARAMKLYGSDQQVEDIEAVRTDMVRNGLLPEDGRINVFGASGAGVLAQQYVSKYASHVKRLILESTGAPDLALRAGQPYSPDLQDFNPQAAKVLAPWLQRHPSAKARAANVLYQQGRSASEPRTAQLRTAQDLAKGGWLLKYELSPRSNLVLLNYIVKTPKTVMARVRWFELVGADLMRYDTIKQTNLLYEISSVAVSDFLDWHRRNHIAPKRFDIDRRFPGETLIIKGTDDVVFGDAASELLRDAYPNARLLYFRDGHRLQARKAAYRATRIGFLERGFMGIDTRPENIH